MARKHDFIAKVDRFIGEEILKLRLAKGLSRQQLAKSIGVTHQQLYKYELGSNRIAVGRLLLIADALDASLDFLFLKSKYEGLESPAIQHQRLSLEVARNFMKLTNPQHQKSVHLLIKTLIKNPSND